MITNKKNAPSNFIEDEEYPRLMVSGVANHRLRLDGTLKDLVRSAEALVNKFGQNVKYTTEYNGNIVIPFQRPESESEYTTRVKRAKKRIEREQAMYKQLHKKYGAK